MKITRNNLSFNVDEKTPNEEFWKNTNWESETYRVFDEQLQKDKSYLDIGTWIGPTVLYGAQLAKKVYTFEPDPVAWEEFQKNLSLNDFTNVSAYNFGLSNQTGTVRMGSDNRLGESVTRVGKFKDELSFDAECRSFDSFISSLNTDEINDLNFIKLDIEGGEYLIAQSNFLKNNPLPMLLSIHPPMMPNFRENIESIIDLRSYYLSCIHISPQYAGRSVTDEDFRTLNDFYTVLLT